MFHLPIKKAVINKNQTALRVCPFCHPGFVKKVYQHYGVACTFLPRRSRQNGANAIEQISPVDCLASRRRQSSLPAPVQIKNPAIKRGFQICARRESNPHFQLRRLTLYPLNYERDKAVVSFILQNYARALEKIPKIRRWRVPGARGICAEAPTR